MRMAMLHPSMYARFIPSIQAAPLLQGCGNRMISAPESSATSMVRSLEQSSTTIVRETKGLAFMITLPSVVASLNAGITKKIPSAAEIVPCSDPAGEEGVVPSLPEKTAGRIGAGESTDKNLS